MSDNKVAVMSYYGFVEAKQKTELAALFSEDTVYKRCEDVYLGKKEVMDFLLNKRKLVGAHTILKLQQDDQTVIVRGIYDGENSAGEKIHMFFSDFFTFNENGLIYTRETYLAQGAEKIQ